MKKNVFKSIILPIIIWLTASVTVVALACSILWLLVFGIKSLFWLEETVYHRPAIIEHTYVKKIQDESNNFYFLDGENILKNNIDNKLERIDVIDKNVIPTLFSSYCDYNNNRLLFYGLLNKNILGVDRGIVIYDNTFEIVKVIPEDYTVSCMSIDNEFLYCYCYRYLQNEHRNHYCLIKYNIESLDRVVLADDFMAGNVYSDENVTLFVQYAAGNHLVLYNTKNSIFYSNIDKFSCFEATKKTITGQIDNRTLKINYLEEELFFNLPFEKTYFYDNVYVNEEYLLVGVMEYIANDECDPTWWSYGCICHYGRSLLLRYDFESKEFSIVQNYDTGTVLVDYDEFGSNYYHDGKLYNHNTVVKECSTIKPSGEIIIKGDNHYSFDCDYWIVGFDSEEPYAFVYEPYNYK